MPNLRAKDRIRGCLLGGAVGDALGAGVEFITLEQIRGEHGRAGIEQFIPAYGRLGAITDDTQMSLFSAEGLVVAAQRFRRDDGVVLMPEMVYRAYLRWLTSQGDELPEQWRGKEILEEGWLLLEPEIRARRAPGKTCLEALNSGVMGTAAAPVNNSKGCGAVMRAAPFGLTTPTPERAFQLGVAGGALTHGHPSGYLAAGCLAAIIAALCADVPIDGAITAGLDLVTAYGSDGAEVAAAIRRAVVLAASDEEPSAALVTSLGEGWVADEALAIAVYCALAARNVRRGLLLAVNHSGDSDSTGSITGNLLGAAYGDMAIPEEWIAALEMRAVIDDVATRLAAEFAAGR